MMVCEHEALQTLVPDLLSQRQGRDVAAIGMLARVRVDFEKQAVFHPEETNGFQPVKDFVVVVLDHGQEEHDQQDQHDREEGIARFGHLLPDPFARAHEKGEHEQEDDKQKRVPR